jgi:predicted metal-dependent hydrolase
LKLKKAKAGITPVALKQIISDWAGKIGVKVGQIHIRAMKNKWASCSTSGRVTMDASVMGLDKPLVDYIIVHELLHLRIPNHGKLWKSMMRAYLGEYEERERELGELSRI